MNVNETWVHYYELVNKVQSRQWVGTGFSRQNKFKAQPSADKMMATVFWEAKGVMLSSILNEEKCNKWSVLCKLTRSAENRYP